MWLEAIRSGIVRKRNEILENSGNSAKFLEILEILRRFLEFS